jgi:hypothetical protein
VTPPHPGLAGILAVLLGATAVSARAQQGPPPPEGSGATVTVVPGAHYEKGSVYRTFMGAGYRDLWTTPITVPVADLSTLAGGLTAVRLGGGMTTRTLHLDGADGRRYVFRSVDKVPADLLADFVGTPIEAVLQDQVSVFNPSGALVVAGLLDALDILHPEPQLVVVPDDPRLGEFREQFAGMLALFEERPDDLPDGEAGFAGSRRIIQTEDLFDTLEEEPDNHVALDELLRSRLLDILVGDRDRSTNNHLWARFEDPAGGRVWRVVPRDRDQAFVQFDGLLKGLARLHDYRLITFGDDYPSIRGLTRNAWDIDRWLLVGVDRNAWDATVADVQRLLTDDVIDRAVRRLPPEHYAIVGPRLADALKHRRDELPEAADELYGFVFQYAEIHTTDEDELATVERGADGSVRVVVRTVAPDPGVLFDRTFVPNETEEVRLYMHGGDDEVTVTGSGPGSIRLRAVGGGSADRFVDESSTSPGRNEFYDGGDATEVVGGRGTRFHDEDVPRRYSWLDDVRSLDWGLEWEPLPIGGYDADRGLVLGASFLIDTYAFMKDPYSTRTRLEIAWAFGLSKPLIDLQQSFRDALFGADLSVQARVSGMEVIDFYGLGNETPQVGSLHFHRLPHTQVTVSSALAFGDGEGKRFAVGPVFEYMATDTTGASRFIATTDPYGSGGFAQAGLGATLEINAREPAGTPSSGYFLRAGGSFFPEMLDVDRGSFGEAHAMAATYLSPPGGNPTLAVRAEGKKVWGTYPFAQAAFLGGASGLRGLREQRYAGDASLLGSAELRVYLARLLFLIPSDFGVLALTDAGRVFLDGESSDTWRTSWGGGVWFAPLLRSSTVQVLAVRARGRTSFQAGLGFTF